MAIIKNKKQKIKAPKITAEEAAVIAAKTGYSLSGVQRIVRTRSANPRQPCPHQEENCQSDFDTIKVDIPLTMEEKLVLSDKTGYSPASIDRIIRGYSPVLPRHKKLVELYKKMMHLKQLHHENYITDINSL